MDLIASCDPDTGLPERWLLRDRCVNTSFNWGERESSRRVQLSQKNDFALLSKNPTPLFETGESTVIADDVAEIFEEFKTKMNLISPLIDLTSTKMYSEESSDGIQVCVLKLMLIFTTKIEPSSFKERIFYVGCCGQRASLQN